MVVVRSSTTCGRLVPQVHRSDGKARKGMNARQQTHSLTAVRLAQPVQNCNVAFFNLGVEFQGILRPQMVKVRPSSEGKRLPFVPSSNLELLSLCVFVSKSVSALEGKPLLGPV